MTPEAQAWLQATAEAAQNGGHIFPQMAACEVGLESGYGSSGLAKDDNNLFGTKQHSHPIYQTVNIPTKEFLKGQWTVVNAAWVKYPTLADCFSDRMVTLRRLKDAYPHYGLALVAADPITYVTEVSKSWSTDPNRASKVIGIYRTYFG